MLNFLKRLLPRESLPPHLHVHFDDAGNEVLCDESICRPQTRSTPLLLPFR